MERTVPDISFQRLESTTSHMALGSLFVLDRNINFKLFCKKFDEITLNFLIFRKKLEKLCTNNWRNDPDFSINRQMFYKHKPHFTNEIDLIKEAEKEFSTALDFNLPLWRIVVFSNQPETCQDKYDNCENLVVGIVFIIHHAVTDGVGALQILEFLETRCQEQDHLNKRATFTDRLTAKRNSEEARPVYQIVINCFRKILKDVKRKTVNTPLRGTGSKERRLLVFDIPRIELKKIKNSTGHSIAVSLLCIISGAVRKYHLALGLKAQDTQIVMPLSARARHSESITGNAHTTFSLDLPISVEDPLERLAIIGRNLETMNSEGTVEVNIILASILNKFPKSIALKMLDSCLKPATLFCTIIPWRLRPFHILGARVKSNYGLIPHLKGFGLSVGFIIYCDKVCTSIITDPEIVHDPGKFEQYFNDSFDGLKTVVFNISKE